MDPKALAKSKRSHSQHHSKKAHHQNQKAKAPSVGTVEAGDAKKPSGKQVREKPHQSKGSASLPSNWDRYEEEFDSASEDPSRDGKSPTTADVVLPKSKGADYRHLISEAQSQFQSNSYSETFASLDDVLPDFNQGVGSMLSIRGQSILSWIGDDNFIVGDKATTSHEAPFLSLNLHVLAEQLAKVDLSKRLFIEADLLPPELCTEALEGSSNRESEQMQTACTSEAATRISDELAFDDFSDEEKIADQDSEVMSSPIPGSSDPVPTSSIQRLESVNQMMDDLRQLGETGQSSGLESIGQPKKDSVTDAKEKESLFEAAAAEAELDMLLNSFSETKFLDSSGFEEKCGNTLPVSRETLTATPQNSRKCPDLSKTAPVTANFDYAIDDLLEETSNLMSKNGASRAQEVTTPLHGSSSHSSHSIPKSKVLDDFDSWLDTI